MTPPKKPLLIIGGGLAGLFCALKLAPLPVTILVGTKIGTGASSVWAQGGIAAALAEGDSPEQHAQDTIAAGAGLVDPSVTLNMVQEAEVRIRDLLAYGVPFDRDLAGHLLQSQEAAHTKRRIVRVGGDMAGKAIMMALVHAVYHTPSITLREGYVVQELVVSSQKRVEGVIARVNETGQLKLLPARAVVLATGGIGQLYQVTTNPPQSQGLGVAIAAKAGALIMDAEFVQFHPTALDIGRDPAPLATEALRGEGATLVNELGIRFMLPLHPKAELAPRDCVARAVAAQLEQGHRVFLDARTSVGVDFKDKFPTVYKVCQEAGIDPAHELIPVASAEHYHMGGVWTDERGRSSLPGLWAAGEVASTGVHGANRLASNSLLEACVFAARIAQDLKALSELPEEQEEDLQEAEAQEKDLGYDPPPEPELIHALRTLNAQYLGVMRGEAGLTQAIQHIKQIQAQARSLTVQNMAITSLLIATAALRRRESRGAHARADYPLTDPGQAKRSSLHIWEL